MTRQPTPVNILDAVLTTDATGPDRTALRARLRWDYSQVAPVDRKQVEDAAVDILANGQRMQQSTVAIGERLIAVKRLLDHGQFGDWCDQEFGMSTRTAQNLMNIARTFDGKSAEISLLSDSSLALLAAPSTPEPARRQAIEEAQSAGKSPSVARTKEIIAEHKPGPVPQPIPSPTAKEYGAAVQATRTYWSPAAAPIPAGWDDDDEAEYQALLPTWQQPAGQFHAISELDRITLRRVAERLSLERLDNLRFSLEERRRILWLEERRQERQASAISNQQSPISNYAPANEPLELRSVDRLADQYVRHLLKQMGANAALDHVTSMGAIREIERLLIVRTSIARLVATYASDLLTRILALEVSTDEEAPPHYTARQPHDERIGQAQRLMALYGAVIDSEDQYGELTGRFSDTLAVKRELTHMISHLSDLIAAITHPEESA